MAWGELTRQGSLPTEEHNPFDEACPRLREYDLKVIAQVPHDWSDRSANRWVDWGALDPDEQAELERLIMKAQQPYRPA